MHGRKNIKPNCSYQIYHIKYFITLQMLEAASAGFMVADVIEYKV